MFSFPRVPPVSGAATRFVCVTLFLFCAFGSAAWADTLNTNNGEIVHGQELRLADGKISLKSDAFGKIQVPADKVRSVTTDKPVAVTFGNGRLVGRIVGAGTGRMSVQSKSGALSVPFEMAAVRAIAAPDAKPAEQTWKTSGNVNLGFTSTHGNTDAELYHGDAEATARKGKNRYKGRGEFNFRRENGEELANDALLKLKHDYFVGKKWFLYTSLGFDHDTEQDLDLRTDIGTGAGYQILDTARTSISVEGGPSYVIEDYANGGDDSYVALRWAADAKYSPVLDKVTLFHNHEILTGVTGDGGTLVKTRTGVRYSIGGGFIASLQVKLDWNSQPSPGEDETDTTYMATLGYAW